MELVLLKDLLVTEMPNQVKMKQLVDFKSNFLNLSNIDIKKNQTKVVVNKVLTEDNIKINLDENATLTYITFDEGKNEHAYNYFTANLQKNATLKIYNVITTSFHHNIKGMVYLNNIGASVEIINLLLGTKNAQINSDIDIYHYQANTNSNLTNYAIAKDFANVLLNNNATIKKFASSSVAHQQTKGLTISKDAKIKALPNLYIDEYDVIAGHACAIGSINKDDLFYLMSRGLSEAEASKIVVMGYVRPILDHIVDQELKQKIEQVFANKLLNE